MAILDPGPDDDAHLQRCSRRRAGERVAYIVVTHTHRDHSALAGRLAAATGAPSGRRAAACRRAPARRRASTPRMTSPTRRTRVLAEGESIAFGGHSADGARDARPRRQSPLLRLGRRSVQRRSRHGVVDLGRRAARRRRWATTWPRWRSCATARRRSIGPATAGRCAIPTVTCAASSPIAASARAAILARLEAGPATIREIVEKNYVGLAPRLKGAAALSTLAHLEDLIARGLAHARRRRAAGGGVREGETSASRGRHLA